MSDMVVNYQDKVVEKINKTLEKMHEPLEQERPDEQYPWMVFSIENINYAINARHVLRIAVLNEIIPFENAPVHCPGIAWSRDGMALLLDLRLLFGQGDYRSFLMKGKNLLPMIIVIELDGQMCGLIVDKVIEMEYFSALIEDVQHPIISPDSFCGLDIEQPKIKIDWNARVDVRLLAKELHENGS